MVETIESYVPATPHCRGQEKIVETHPSSTPSCAVFNAALPQPLDVALDTINSLSLDNEFLELCLNEIDGNAGMTPTTLGSSPTQPDSRNNSSFIPQSNNQECTNDVYLPMDNPLFDQFTDLTSLIDASFLTSLSMPADILQPADSDKSVSLCDTIIDVESPSSELTTASPLSTAPTTPSDNVVPSCSPLPLHPLERKRKSTSSSDDVVVLPKAAKKSPEDKYVERRKKNNVASQVSRAKRRKKNGDLFVREKELEEQNAELRVKVDEMSKEAEQLKKLLVQHMAMAQ